MRKHINAFGGRLIRSSDVRLRVRVVDEDEVDEDEDEGDNVTAAAENAVFVMGDASGVGSPWCLV